MTTRLSDKAKDLLARPVIASLATIDPKGTPQITPLWIDVDGDNLVINTARGRVKANNIESNPHVAISVIDPENPYNVVAVRGTVVDITTDGADQHIDFLAHKYLGVDEYPMRQPGEERIKVTIRPDRISMQSD